MMQVGERWESTGSELRTRGVCVAVEPNDSSESPGSWKMRRLSDGKTLYAHRVDVARGEWVRVGLLARARAWLRDNGLAPFGFEEWAWRGRYLVVRTWGPFVPSQWEVWRWPRNSDPVGNRAHLSTLPVGSYDRYHRLNLSADRVFDISAGRAREANDFDDAIRHADADKARLRSGRHALAGGLPS